VCHNVVIEPSLQSLSGQIFSHLTANVDDGARADHKARSFWTAHQNAYFDIRVFYPNASSYHSLSLSSTYCNYKQTKKGGYCEHVREEVKHGMFTPWFYLLQVVWLMKQLFSISNWQSW